MRRVLGVCAAAALAACGGSSGGGGGGGGAVTVGGPITGDLSNTGAVVASGSCTESGVPLTGSVALVAFSTAPNLCQDAQQGRDAAGATTLNLVLAKLNAGGASAPLAAGTYTVTSGVPTPDASGNFNVVSIQVERNGTTLDTGDPSGGCTSAASSEAATGSVTLSSVTSSRIAGTVSATLQNGGAVTGSFDVPLCSFPVTIGPGCGDFGGIPSTRTCQ